MFSQKGNFRVVRLSEADAHAGSDHLKKLRELVLENEPMYPHIDKWFDAKVVPGLKNSERIGYVGYLDDEPAVLSVLEEILLASNATTVSFSDSSKALDYYKGNQKNIDFHDLCHLQ